VQILWRKKQQPRLFGAKNPYISIHIYPYTYLYIHIHIYTYLYISICIYTYLYTHKSSWMCIANHVNHPVYNRLGYVIKKMVMDTSGEIDDTCLTKALYLEKIWPFKSIQNTFRGFMGLPPLEHAPICKGGYPRGNNAPEGLEASNRALKDFTQSESEAMVYCNLRMETRGQSYLSSTCSSIIVATLFVLFLWSWMNLKTRPFEQRLKRFRILGWTWLMFNLNIPAEPDVRPCSHILQLLP
jgi:hypothetical protein